MDSFYLPIKYRLPMNYQEPTILWTPIRFRQQTPNACCANAIAACLEKRLEQKGYNVHLDEKAFENALRIDQKKFEGGLSTIKALKYLRNHGIESYKIKGFTITKPNDTSLIREMLYYDPLLASMNIYRVKKEDREEGFYKISDIKVARHLVVIMGYEKGCFLILDSNCPKSLQRIKENDFSTMVLKVYSLNL